MGKEYPYCIINETILAKLREQVGPERFTQMGDKLLFDVHGDGWDIVEIVLSKPVDWGSSTYNPPAI